MNPFDLRVTRVHGELPIGGVVPSVVLDDYIGAAAVLRRNRSRAAQVLARARHRRRAVREQAERLLEAAREEAERRAAEAARAAHDQTCMQVVQWLVDERALEQRLTDAIEQRCRAWAHAAMREYAAEVDRDQLLAHRVLAGMKPLLRHGELSLRVSPAQHESVAARVVGTDGVQVQEDAALEPGQAVLDSPYVQLRIDVGRHLSTLLGALRGDEPAIGEQAAAAAMAAIGPDGVTDGVTDGALQDWADSDARRRLDADEATDWDNGPTNEVADAAAAHWADPSFDQRMVQSAHPPAHRLNPDDDDEWGDGSEDDWFNGSTRMTEAPSWKTPESEQEPRALGRRFADPPEEGDGA